MPPQKEPPALVTIVVPTKGRVDLLLETIESVRGQSCPHWELIIVDDGSAEDAVEDVKRRYADDPRITMVARQGTKSGAPVCRNQGVQRGKGKYLLFLDSDDLLTVDTLKRRVAFLQSHPEIDFCIAQCWLFRDKPGDREGLFNKIGSENDLERFLQFDWPWQTSGPLWKKAAFERIGGWDEELRVGQDMDIACRAIVLGLRYEWLETPDFYYRVFSNTVSKVGANPFSPAKLPSQVRRISNLLELLKTEEKLTPELTAVLMGNLLLFAQQGIRGGNPKEARNTWKRAQTYHIASPGQFFQGRLFLDMVALGFETFGAALLKRFWPESALFFLDLRSLYYQNERQVETFRRVIAYKEEGRVAEAMKEHLVGFFQSPGLLRNRDYHRLFASLVLSGMTRRKRPE
jgi:hypothetical protein